MASFNEQLLENARPNFFELVATEAMQDALRPAFQYICKVLVQSRPDLFDRLWRFSDELYTILESLLQLYFLSRYSGSFSEQFYSLVRSPAGIQGNGPLNKQRILSSLLCLCLAPYLKVKLDGLYLTLQEQDDQLPFTWERNSFKYTFYSVYPYLSALWQSTRLIYRFRYLFGRTDCYSPLHRLAGITLKRGSELPSNVESSGWLSHVTSWLTASALFGVKFLEWWYSTERSRAISAVTSLPAPPPPQPRQPSSNGVRVPTNPLLCPLCLGQRVEPTTITSSGYVFCYACILHYLRENAVCPITSLPTSQKQLVRLYTNSS